MVVNYIFISYYLKEKYKGAFLSGVNPTLA